MIHSTTANPYAPPTSALEPLQPEADPATLVEFPWARIAPSRMVLLSLLTLGLYSPVWFWTQWSAIRRAEGEAPLPILETLFGDISIIGLSQQVRFSAAQHDSRRPVLPAWGYALAGFAYWFAASFLEVETWTPAQAIAAVIPVLLLLSAFLVDIQTSMNHLIEKSDPGRPWRSGITVWTVLGVAAALAAHATWLLL